MSRNKLSPGSGRASVTDGSAHSEGLRLEEAAQRDRDRQRNSNTRESGISAETQELREWQRGLTQIFKSAVLPATQKIYDLLKSNDMDERVFEDRLKEYYGSVSREKIDEREIVWGEAGERKIETMLLSPKKVKGAPARFLRCQYQAATGAGKTRSMIEMIRIHLESGTRANKEIHPLYLVVEPTLNLVKQTYQAALELKELECFCVCSSTNVPSRSKQEAASQAKRRSRPMLIITTKQSAAGRVKEQVLDGTGLLDIFSQQNIIVDLLLLDECHLLAGDSAGKVQKEVYIKNCHSAMLKVSFTATPRALPPSSEHSNGFPFTSEDGDESFLCQNSVDGVFGPVMYRYTYEDALEDKVVAPFSFALMDNTLPESSTLKEYLQSQIKGWDEENSKTSQSWPAFQSTTNIDPLDASTEKQRPYDEMTWKCERMMMMLRILHEFATGRQTHVIAFCTLIKERARKLCALMRYLCKEQIESINAGRSLLGFSMGSPEHKRLSILHDNCYYDVSGSDTCSSGKDGFKRFQHAKVAFLSNVNRLTTGTDIPQITGIFFPDIKGHTNSQTLIQCIGRGTRLFHGKEKCTVFLPCFVPQINLTLDSDLPEEKEALAELERRKKINNWEGKFSKMALEIYNFMKQNEHAGENPLSIECVPSRSIFSEHFPNNSTNVNGTGIHNQERHRSRTETAKMNHIFKIGKGGFGAMRRPSESSRQFRNGPIMDTTQQENPWVVGR